jgi:hypothetical protein
MVNAWNEPMNDVGPCGPGPGQRREVPAAAAAGLQCGNPGRLRSRQISDIQRLRALSGNPQQSKRDRCCGRIGVGEEDTGLSARAGRQPARTALHRYLRKNLRWHCRFRRAFFERLNRMVQEEPVLPRDPVTMGMLKSIGIQKGNACRSTVTMSVYRCRAEVVGTWPKRRY